MTQQIRLRSADSQPNGVHLVREVAIRYRRRRRLPQLLDARGVATFVEHIVDGAREHIIVIYLDSRHAPIGWQVVSIGTASSSLVHPREVFQPAVAIGAVGIVLAHNHPSGDPSPSAEDREVTRRVFDAGDLLGIKLLDHVVVGTGGRHWSFREEGEMPRSLVAQPEASRRG